MEDHKDGMKELLESDHFHFKIKVSEADAEGAKVFMEAHGRHVQEGPDVLTFVMPPMTMKATREGKEITGKVRDFNLNFKTTFAPGSGTGQDLRCVIAGEVIIIRALDATPEDWSVFAAELTERNAAWGLTVPEPREGAIRVPGRTDFFKAPGRLFDTPRHITGQGKTELLPEISR